MAHEGRFLITEAGVAMDRPLPKYAHMYFDPTDRCLYAMLADGTKFKYVPDGKSDRYADVVSAILQRRYYDNITDATDSVKPGETLNLYSPIVVSQFQGGEAFLYFKDNVTINVYGVLLKAPGSNSDVITLAGKNILNGYNSTVTQNPNGAPGGWLLGLYSGVSVDAQINDVNFNVPANSACMPLFGYGKVRYKGDIESAGRYAIRVAGSDYLDFYGKGNISQTAGGYPIWMGSEKSSATWEGNISLRQNAVINMYAGQLTLRNGLISCGINYAVNGPQGFINTPTLILENYSVLGSFSDSPVIRCPNVILRGNSVVRGTIYCTNFQDDRPAPFYGTSIVADL